MTDGWRIGGSACLDLCNTVSWRTSDRPVECLSRWPEVAREPDVYDVRSLLGRTFDALAEGAEPDPRDLLEVRDRYCAALARATPRPGSVDWSRPLDEVVASAWELLQGAERARIRRCEGDGCGWLFLDGTKNGSRRYCSPEDCGRRERLRRHRARRRAGA